MRIQRSLSISFSLSLTAALTSACALDDEPALDDVEQAFSEANCRTAPADLAVEGELPDTVFKVPGQPPRTVDGFRIAAPYNNPKCYRAYVITLDHANLDVHNFEVSWNDTHSPGGQAGCEAEVVAIEAYAQASYRIKIGSVVQTRRTSLSHVGLVEATGQWVNGGCRLSAKIDVPNTELTGILFDYSYRIHVTGRFADNTTATLWLR